MIKSVKTAVAVCVTYGRIPYLGQMLAGFVSQTYDPKHLVIVNDDPRIQLRCIRSDVTILNCPNRMTVGQKRNLGAAVGNYDVIFPWDDDDIFFPMRMENHMKQYVDPEVHAYRNYPCYIIYNSIFSPDECGVNNKSYLKSEWEKCGGYADIWWGEDLELHKKLSGFKHGNNTQERDFCYGFSTSNYHLSNGWEGLDSLAYQQLKILNLLDKEFWIEPDFETYFKFLTVERLYKQTNTPIPLTILPDGDIDISNLL